eukprot:TRINITY_DN4787_c0_g1_i3.p10 TRINITY_DN4787_c0_g1~~TRINITY_DN4787_c0_g1_i3.p10  ORF type:complete len:135 (-),score=0.22 TRINITY_DN4787_c0_g1_i3:1897-2301(-)
MVDRGSRMKLHRSQWSLHLGLIHNLVAKSTIKLHVTRLSQSTQNGYSLSIPIKVRKEGKRELWHLIRISFVYGIQSRQNPRNFRLTSSEKDLVRIKVSIKRKLVMIRIRIKLKQVREQTQLESSFLLLAQVASA